MKNCLTIFIVLFSSSLWAQKDIPVTDHFIITGHIKKEIQFTLDDLKKMAPVPMPEIESKIIVSRTR